MCGCVVRSCENTLARRATCPLLYFSLGNQVGSVAASEPCHVRPSLLKPAQNSSELPRRRTVSLCIDLILAPCILSGGLPFYLHHHCVLDSVASECGNAHILTPTCANTKAHAHTRMLHGRKYINIQVACNDASSQASVIRCTYCISEQWGWLSEHLVGKKMEANLCTSGLCPCNLIGERRWCWRCWSTAL